MDIERTGKISCEVERCTGSNLPVLDDGNAFALGM
jgi:hypothetical protein